MGRRAPVRGLGQWAATPLQVVMTRVNVATRERGDWLMISITDKKVLVVGGSSGIGLATARAAANAGARVTIAARSKARLAAAIAAIGPNVTRRQLDAGDDASVAAFFADAGEWDHVVATAGKGGRGRLPDIAMPDALDAMNAKFWSYYRIARAARIASGGSLTFVSGTIGSKPTPGAALVSAINAAIEGLARGLALDLSPVRVNTVSPGIIDTPLWDRLSEGERQALFDRAAANLPARRIGQPEDVAQAILFLMTNPFATGTVVHLEGGGLLL
ncbi:MAG: short-chain dehydrogenase/reductase [Rhodospirillales bacterium]|nr:short-chain dehydrogenase/reductase [Rhodospirillales bacterium]